MVNLFNLFEITPLWQKQREDDQYLFIAMFIGIIGLTHTFFAFTISLTAKFSVALFEVANTEIPLLLYILSNFPYSFLIALFIDFIAAYMLVSSDKFMRDIDLNNEFDELRESIENTLEVEESDRSINSVLITYIISVLVLGMIAGLWYTIIMYIPFFILSIFIFIILFTSFSSGTSITISILISWSIIHYFLIKSKFSIEEEIYDNKTELDISSRRLSIIASREEPIVCPACRSYISAKSKFCQICDERIISEQSASSEEQNKDTDLQA